VLPATTRLSRFYATSAVALVRRTHEHERGTEFEYWNWA
jgi:hypothetical protein